MAAIGSTVAAPDALGVQAPRLNAWPNPSSDEVRFRIQLPASISGNAVLEIYSVDGRRVQRFTKLTAATPVRWDGRDERGQKLPAGIYLARLQAGEWQATGKVILER
jgi:flagellar hook assembly protein FlgD